MLFIVKVEIPVQLYFTIEKKSKFIIRHLEIISILTTFKVFLTQKENKPPRMQCPKNSPFLQLVFFKWKPLLQYQVKLESNEKRGKWGSLREVVRNGSLHNQQTFLNLSEHGKCKINIQTSIIRIFFLSSFESCNRSNFLNRFTDDSIFDMSLGVEQIDSIRKEGEKEKLVQTKYLNSYLFSMCRRFLLGNYQKSTCNFDMHISNMKTVNIFLVLL